VKQTILLSKTVIKPRYFYNICSCSEHSNTQFDWEYVLWIFIIWVSSSK